MQTLFTLCFAISTITVYGSQALTASTNESFHATYHTLDEITTFINNLTNTFPDVTTLKSIGKTYEGRDIHAIEVAPAKDFENLSERQAVILECGIHAREWISPASCLWVAEQVAKHYSNQEVDDKFSQFNFPRSTSFMIIPNLNPDGYVYTWTTNRWWRKNRRPLVSNSRETSMCTGVDLNRNAGFEWQPLKMSTNGSVDISYCQRTYPGTEPFSENETKALRDYVRDVKRRFDITAYFAVHSYSQVIMYPYGHTSEKTKDYDEHKRVSELASDAIKTLYGIEYNYYQSVNMYETHGTTIDYFYAKEGINYAFCIELRPSDESDVYFMLANEEIVQTAQELWAGVSTVASNAYPPRVYEVMKTIKKLEETIKSLEQPDKTVEIRDIKSTVHNLSVVTKVFGCVIVCLALIAVVVFVKKQKLKENKVVIRNGTASALSV